MSRRKLMIPGTGGVLFQKSSGGQAGSVFELLSKPARRKALACVHSSRSNVLRPVSTSGLAGVGLLARGHMSLAYAPLDYAVPAWTFFDYDWRLDLRYNGQLLHRYLLAQAQTGDRWHVVAHSQGGLVLLWAARAMGAEAFARLVHSVVFVGVPFFGTFNALEALVQGYFINRSIPVELARTWPSLYQMLPRWGLEDGDPKRANALLNSTWSGAQLFPSSSARLDLRRHIDPHLLTRARAWYKATERHYFDALAQVKYVRIIFGRGHETRIAVERFPRFEPATMQDGDSLVPDLLTYQSLPNWVRDEANIQRFVAGEHSMLCSDANVYEWCT